MYKIVKKLKEKLQEKLSQKGQGMVEYAIIIAVVAVIAVAVLGTGTVEEGENAKPSLTNAIGGAFATATEKINTASGKTTQSTGGGN